MSLGTVTAGLQGAGGGGASIPDWSALPTGTEDDREPVTLDSAPAVAERGPLYWHPGYPTKAQLDSLWPSVDQSPGLRVGPMRRYWQAIAEQKPIKIMVIGDSNSVGQGKTGGNTGCRAISWPKLLATRYGWRDGMAFGNGLSASDPRLTYDGWFSNIKTCLGGAWQSNNGGEDLEFAPGIACDSVTVTGIAVFGAGGTSTVYVDGVSAGTITHDTSINGGNALPQITWTGTRGVHTIRVSNNGVGTCWINSIQTFDSQSTVPDLYHCGVADANMGDLNADGQPYDNRKHLRQIRPDLVILAATINDLDDGASVAAITAGMDLVRRNVRENGGELMGICGWATNRPGVTKANLDLLLAHLLTLSEEDGTACIDNRGALGYTYATTNPAYVADDWHLNTAGYAAMEDQIRKAFG